MESRANEIAQAISQGSALTGLKARIGLIDDKNAALAAHDLVVAVATAQGFQ
jgi:hypothetical protein